MIIKPTLKVTGLAPREKIVQMSGLEHLTCYYIQIETHSHFLQKIRNASIKSGIAKMFENQRLDTQSTTCVNFKTFAEMCKPLGVHWYSMEDLKRRMHTGKLVTRKLQANFNCEH